MGSDDAKLPPGGTDSAGDASSTSRTSGTGDIGLRFFNLLTQKQIYLLDGLDDVDLLLDHTVDSVKNFFTAFLNLGTSLFPFIPAEWLTIIEAALVILAIGVIIKRRVF